jgi:hypothetical protein
MIDEQKTCLGSIDFVPVAASEAANSWRAFELLSIITYFWI